MLGNITKTNVMKFDQKMVVQRVAILGNERSYKVVKNLNLRITFNYHQIKLLWRHNLNHSCRPCIRKILLLKEYHSL